MFSPHRCRAIPRVRNRRISGRSRNCTVSAAAVYSHSRGMARVRAQRDLAMLKVTAQEYVTV
eukprot:673557-Rhodomonas_salina.1